MLNEIISVSRLVGSGRLDAQLRCGRSTGPAGRNEHGLSTPQWALAWIESGTAVLVDSAGRDWHLQPNSVFQRLPGAMHSVNRLEATVWWYLALPASCHQAARLIGMRSIDLPAFAIRPLPGLAQRFRRTAAALRIAPTERLGQRMAELLGLAMDLHAAAAMHAPHATAVERAARLLEEDPLRRWTTVGLAHAVGLGPHTFRKAFAAAHACGPAAYRLRLRLERAQELLAGTDLRIPAVGQRCGWDDPLQFSACFRRRLGVPPRAWRRNRH